MASMLLVTLRALFGIGVFLFICYLLSQNRKRINWRLVGAGLVLQLLVAFLVLKVPVVAVGFQAVADFFVKLLDFSAEGAAFLFGGLVTDQKSFGFIFAFNVLPTIVFFAAFSSMLYYMGILQRIVFGIAWVMKKTMRLSGAECLATAANIFIGQTEAPFIIKPYLEKMTRSEIMALMTGGMATIAGGVMVSYIGMLGGRSLAGKELFAKHLLTASILSAPAALLVAKMLVPETEPIDEVLALPKEKMGNNILDAAVIGTTDGLKLALNVGAALLAFIALVALVNYLLAHWLGSWTGLNAWIEASTHGAYHELTLQYVLGLLFAPVAWLIGIDSGSLLSVGQLLGERTVLNEFYAYASLAHLKDAGVLTDPRAQMITTYALCGFANFSSMGIQVGGIGALVPSRRDVLASLAFRSMIGGTIACFITACIASLFV